MKKILMRCRWGCFVQAFVGTMVLWFVGAAAVPGQVGEPLCQVTLIEKGALMGHDFRGIATAPGRTEAFALDYSSEGPGHLRLISFNADGAEPRVTDSIENFWDPNDIPPKLFYFAPRGWGVLTPRLYVQGPSSITIVEASPLKVISKWVVLEGTLRDSSFIGHLGLILVERFGEGLHSVELQVVNFGDGTAPAVIGTFARPFDAEGKWRADEMAITSDGRYAYLAQGSKLDVIDIGDPTAPRQVGSFAAEGILNAVTILPSRRRLFVGGVSPLGVVYVLDLTDPADPQLQTTIPTGVINSIEIPKESDFANLLFVNESMFVGGGTEVRGVHIFDLATPNQPQPIGPGIRTFPTDAGAISTVGGQILSFKIKEGGEGGLIISQARVQPRLVMRKLETQVELRWSGGPGFVLEQSPALDIPWINDGHLTYQYDANGLYSTRINAPTANSFFRLMKYAE